MSAIRECLESIKQQRMAGIPKDEILVDPDLAERAVLEGSVWTFGPIPGSVDKILGARIGVPCPRCGRRKPNKGQWSCDGCGKNLLAELDYI